MKNDIGQTSSKRRNKESEKDRIQEKENRKSEVTIDEKKIDGDRKNKRVRQNSTI